MNNVSILSNSTEVKSLKQNYENISKILLIGGCF